MIKDHYPEYWTHPDISEYDVTVTAVKGSNLTLSEPYPFFIEGGGQPNDRVIAIVPGFSNPVPVAKILSLQEISLQVPKKSSFNLSPPTTIKLLLDVEFRQAVMRAHTCQHLLSALLLKNLNIKTLKAVMTDDQGQLMLDGSISLDQIFDLSVQINEFISHKPVPVSSHVLEAGSAVDQAGLPVDLSKIRGSVPKDASFIRVLAIGDGVDLNTCGGTHVSSTGELISFFISTVKKDELQFICGLKSQKYISSLNHALIDSSLTFKQPYEKTLPFISTQLSSLQNEHFELSNHFIYLFKSLIDSLYQQAISLLHSSSVVSIASSSLKEIFPWKTWSSNNTLVFLIDSPADKKLSSEANKIISEFTHSCVSFVISKNETVIISVNQPQKAGYDARDLADSFKQKFSGKGGGNEFFAQVLVQNVTLSNIEEHIKTIFP